MAKKKLLIAAVIVGLVASVLVYYAIEKQDDKVEDVMANQVPVVKAAREIPKGTPLKRDHVTESKVPNQFVPQNVLRKSDIEVYLGQPVKGTVKEGKMITTSDFQVEQVANNLASKVPSGERAMTMPVDNISGVAGLLRPGDRVDILGTFPVSSKGQKIPTGSGGGQESTGYVTMTLLQNVTLLGVGQRISKVEEGAERQGYSTVTMSVTVEEAELMTIAQTRGDLTLLLRNPEDVKIGRIQRKTLRGVLEDLEVINEQRQERIEEKAPAPTPTKEEEDEDIIKRLDRNEK